MKVNTHLLNLVQQILHAKILNEASEVDRLTKLAVNDIINHDDNLKNRPGFSGVAYGIAYRRLVPILDAFMLPE